MNTRTFRSFCLVSACLLATTVMAAATEPLVKITGASPFALCTADHVGNQVGTNYPDTEIEPWIDANPDNLDNLIAGWQQDRWSNGGARGLVSAYSTDSGAHWNAVVVPKITVCSDGIYIRASDPWVTISPNGNAFFMSLAFDEDRPDGGFGRNAMLVSRSQNGGVSWGDPISLIADTDGQVLNDKNSMTADYKNSNFVYAVWDRLQVFVLPSANKSDVAEALVKTHTGDGVAAAQARGRKLKTLALSGRALQGTQFIGPVYFARTINGGNTWQAAKKVFDPGANAQTIGNLIATLPNGTVIDFFTQIFSNGHTKIGMIRSFDRGLNFGPPSYAAESFQSPFGTLTPDARRAVRDASFLFDVAVNRTNGHLYLVWQDVRFSRVDEVAFSMSVNGGQSWSTPIRVNMTPRSTKRLLQQAFVPSVEVAGDGKIVVTYYDFRFDTNDGRERTDYWAVSCDPAAANCRQRANWVSSEQRLTDDSFDILRAPVANGLFLGDYMGLVAGKTNVMPAFGIVDSPLHVSVYTRPID